MQPFDIKTMALSKQRLELCVLRSAGEGHYVAYILHARHKQDETLKAQSEAGMRARPILAGIEIPAVSTLLHAARLNLTEQFVHVFLS